MKPLTATLAAAALAFSMNATAQEENRQTLVIEGTGLGDASDALSVYPTASFYRIFIEFDTSATLLNSDPQVKQYDNAVTLFDIKYYDAQDQLVPGPTITFDGDLPENVAARPDVIFYGNNGSFDRVVVMGSINFNDSSYFWLEPLLSGPSGSIFSDFTSGFPQFNEGAVTNVMNGYTHFGYNSLEQTYAHIDAFGPVATLSYLVLDADGDGVVDNVDTCPVSILDETMLFDGWYDSGVTNYVDANGCSIADHYAACEAVEEEAPRRGIRSVRSGPSSCEKAVSYDLVADGVISYAEARMLREALYESASSTGDR